MNNVRSPFHTAVVPSAAAGPVFLLSTAAASAYSLVPQPIEVPPEYLFAFLAALVPAFVVGFVLSFMLNAIGTKLLWAAGEVSALAREPIVWIATGAAAGLLLAILFGAFPGSGVASFALVSTSALCAGLCRAQTRWETDRVHA